MARIFKLWGVCALFILPAVFLTSYTHAQDAGSTGQVEEKSLNDNQLEKLLELAKERDVRVVVISPDRSSAETAASDKTLIESAYTRWSNFRSEFRQLLSESDSFFDDFSSAFDFDRPDEQATSFTAVFLSTLLILFLGRIGEHFYQLKLTEKCKKIWPGTPTNNPEKMAFLLMEYFGRVIGIVVTSLLAFIVANILFGDHKLITQFLIIVVTAVAVCRMMIGFWRVWLAPEMPDHRIPGISDAQSTNLNYWLIGSAALTCSILGLAHWLRLLELEQNSFKLFALGVSLVFFGFHILLLVLNRQTISQAFGLTGNVGSSRSTWSELVIANWLPLSLVYIVVTALAVTIRLVLEVPGAGNLGAGMVLVVIASLMLYALGTVIIEKCFQPIAQDNKLETSGLKISIDNPDKLEPSDLSEQDQTNKYSILRTPEFSSLARRISAVLIIFFAIGSIFTLWGVGIFDAKSKIVTFWDVILLGFVGYFVYEATRILAKTKIEQKLHSTDNSAGNSNISRLATLLPLFRNFILVAIVAIFLLMILARLGINIAPLLGGAGVVGIALGFGAQTLVRDIFSGAFFLADDSFRRGEIIDVNQVRGTVEKISIRSMQVRSIDGALHTLPFGDIQMVSNFSRDWAMMKLKLRLTFDTDEAKVRKLLKELGKDLKSDPEIGDLFLQPMKSQGITKMDDSAMIIGVKFKTRPGDQWLARRYVFAKIRELFQSEGIRFANREVTVRLSEAEGDDLDQDTKQKIAGAVLPTLETGAAE